MGKLLALIQLYILLLGACGIGFAIPSTLAEGVINQLIKYGKTKRGWLGVRIQTVTPDLAESLGLDRAYGALVAYNA